MNNIAKNEKNARQKYYDSAFLSGKQGGILGKNLTCFLIKGYVF